MKTAILFVTILSSFYLNCNARNFESFTSLKIETDLSYSSKNVSSSTVSQKNANPSIRVITSPAPVRQSGSNSSVSIYGVTRSLKIQPSKDKLTLTFETKRIKDKKGALDIDTDVPSAGDRFNQSALDFYFQQLNVPKKIVLDKSNFVSNTVSEANIGALPQLHSINELSGIFVNYRGNLLKESFWTDTLTNNSGTYINSYNVTNYDASTTTLQLKGKLLVKRERGLTNQEEAEMLEKMKQGANIEVKSSVGKSEYEGEIIIDTQSFFINEMNLRLNKEQSLSVLGQKTASVLEMKYTIHNKIK